jgi:hypothetical protein
MYLHQKQRGASSSSICMSGFLPLNVCNTICPISKWCMCRKWQHGQPFLERCSQNGSKQTKNRKLHEALVQSIPSTMGVEPEVEAMDNAQERLCHWSHVLCTLDIG